MRIVTTGRLLAVAVTLLTGVGMASAQHVHGGYRGYYGGGFGYGRPYGFYPGYYRPYYGLGYGLGVGLGLGLGAGLYAPYYGSYAYPLPNGYMYPGYGAGVYAPPVVAGGAPGGAMPPGGGMPPAQGGPQPGQAPSAPDNAGHLQLVVPANSEVSVNGQPISQTGTTREIVTPTLQPGTRYTYKITVRYPDAQGKMVQDTRDITFQANDWFSIDFTRPAPPQAPAAPPPQPLPNQMR